LPHFENLNLYELKDIGFYTDLTQELEVTKDNIRIPTLKSKENCSYCLQITTYIDGQYYLLGYHWIKKIFGEK